MSKQCNLFFWYLSNKFSDTNWKYCSKKPRITIIFDNKQDSWAKLLIFQHSRKPFLRNLQNHKPCNEVTPCVLLIKLLQSMWKLSVTKPNVSHLLPVSSRLEMDGFTFMNLWTYHFYGLTFMTLLQRRLKFS